MSKNRSKNNRFGSNWSEHFSSINNTEFYRGVRISEPSIRPISNFSCFFQTEFNRIVSISEPSIPPIWNFNLFLQTEFYRSVRISEPSIRPISNFSCFFQTEFNRIASISEPSIHQFGILTYSWKLSSIGLSERPNPLSYGFVILTKLCKLSC